MQYKQKLPLSPLTSEQKEAEFWENHSALDYDLKFSAEQLDVHPDARSIPINLRLPRWLVEDIKALAQGQGTSYQRLIRQVLVAFVENCQQQKSEC